MIDSLFEQHERFQRIVGWYWKTAGPYPMSVDTEVEAGSEVTRRSEVASDRETRVPASATSPHSSPEAVKLARLVLETRYKLADGTELTASRTGMRTDLSNLAWAVINIEEQYEVATRENANLRVFHDQQVEIIERLEEQLESSGIREDLAAQAVRSAEQRIAELQEQLEVAQERLSHIRSMRDTEWAILMREHDIVDEARKLSRAAGEINTTAALDRALKRYDEARGADRESESNPASEPKEDA